jgi:hypothetical protein
MADVTAKHPIALPYPAKEAGAMAQNTSLASKLPRGLWRHSGHRNGCDGPHRLCTRCRARSRRRASCPGRRVEIGAAHYDQAPKARNKAEGATTPRARSSLSLHPATGRPPWGCVHLSA